MTKVDFKKEMPGLYAPKNKDWELVSVPALSFITISGSGDPNTSLSYSEAVEALYALSYKIKFSSKESLGRDYTVMPLEGLWTQDGHEDGANDKSLYRWTMMIMQPDWVTEEMFSSALRTLSEQKVLPALQKASLEHFTEGEAFQLLHIGPYDDEAPKIAHLHEVVMPAAGFSFNGPHHEVYLGDPRRTPPDRLRTVLRQPVCPA